MDIYEARRQALLRLINTRFGGSQAEFVKAVNAAREPTEIKLSRSYVTRMLKPEGDSTKKRVGEELARKIEEDLSLNTDELVRPLNFRHPQIGEAADPDQATKLVAEDVLALYGKLSQAEQQRFSLITQGRQQTHGANNKERREWNDNKQPPQQTTRKFGTTGEAKASKRPGRKKGTT